VKAKHQRLTLAVLAVGAVIAAGLLALSAFKDQAAFFYAPGDLTGKPLPLARAVRLGGMVTPGSLQHAADGVSMRFAVSDGKATVPVRFRGVAPDLFREGSGVIAEGRFNPDGSFVADNLLAKHDERYMPPQLEGKMHKSETLAQ
jgi:cytochrome c-type biogenesis protein CcmE